MVTYFGHSLLAWRGMGGGQTSYKIVNSALSYDERMRHMDTAYRIDIMVRTGIISLLPLSLHMGYIYDIQPLGGIWLTGMWITFVAWFILTWTAFANRNKLLGAKLYTVEDWTRFILIPLLIGAGLTSLMGYGPFSTEEGERWFSAKVITYGLALIIGVILRLVMHEWQTKFKALADGANAAIETKLAKSIFIGRSVAYLYWILIAGTALLEGCQAILTTF